MGLLRYNSKKDWWLTIIIWVAMLFSIGSGCVAFIENPNPGEFLVLLCLGLLLPLFVLWIWLTTYYVLEEKNLVIRFGPFKKTIPVNSIKSVKKTMNPLSSPALSLKRLEIEYGQFDSVLISPEDRDEFIRILADRCPQAKIIK